MNKQCDFCGFVAFWLVLVFFPFGMPHYGYSISFVICFLGNRGASCSLRYRWDIYLYFRVSGNLKTTSELLCHFFTFLGHKIVTLFCTKNQSIKYNILNYLKMIQWEIGSLHSEGWIIELNFYGCKNRCLGGLWKNAYKKTGICIK